VVVQILPAHPIKFMALLIGSSLIWKKNWKIKAQLQVALGRQAHYFPAQTNYLVLMLPLMAEQLYHDAALHLIWA
jgi:hypothetical protein